LGWGLASSFGVFLCELRMLPSPALARDGQIQKDRESFSIQFSGEKVSFRRDRRTVQSLAREIVETTPHSPKASFLGGHIK
jgi:hypothetical protein